MKNIFLLIGFILATSCNDKNTNQKVENQCDISHIKSINNGKISFYQVSESERKLVVKPVDKVQDLVVLCKEDVVFPKEIVQLKHLRTLSLLGGNFKELPIEMSELDNLQSLILVNSSVEHLPIEVYQVLAFKRLAIMYNLREFEFGEELCKSNMVLEVMYTSTIIKELPDCLKGSNKIELINKEAY